MTNAYESGGVWRLYIQGQMATYGGSPITAKSVARWSPHTGFLPGCGLPTERRDVVCFAEIVLLLIH